MYSRFKLARKYLHYLLTASNGKGHGIHSPFVFDLIIHVLNDQHVYPEYARIRQLRRQLLQDGTMLEIKDLGAGSALNSAGALREGTPAAGALHGVEPASGASRGMEGHGIAEGNGRVVHRRVSDLARHAAKSEKLGKLLFRIARYYDPGLILELGTSLGLSTAYLATGGKHAGVVTIEGAEAVAAVAAQNLQSLGLGAVEVVKGNFDDVLIPTLSKKMPADLAFIDGNHRKEPTIRYFNLLMDRMSPASILIFDDIHWSQEMEAAWEVIKQDPRVYLTVDLFFTGLVFLRSEFKVKQHFTIRF